MVQFLGSLSRICGQFLFLCQEASTLPEALIGVSLLIGYPMVRLVGLEDRIVH